MEGDERGTIRGAPATPVVGLGRIMTDLKRTNKYAPETWKNIGSLGVSQAQLIGTRRTTKVPRIATVPPPNRNLAIRPDKILTASPLQGGKARLAVSFWAVLGSPGLSWDVLPSHPGHRHNELRALFDFHFDLIFCRRRLV